MTRIGNHVGDWEHVMVRFEHGIPKLVWLSQHASGQAFNYELLANRYNSGPRVSRATQITNDCAKMKKIDSLLHFLPTARMPFTRLMAFMIIHYQRIIIVTQVSSTTTQIGVSCMIPLNPHTGTSGRRQLRDLMSNRVSSRHMISHILLDTLNFWDNGVT
jgi:Vacuolar protein sorting-associated protein 62